MNAIELAKQTGLNKNTVYKLIREGMLKATKVGKSYEVDEEEAKNFIQSRYPNKVMQDRFTSTQFISNDLEYQQADEVILTMFLISDIYKDINNSFSDFQNQKITKEELYAEIINRKKDDSFPKLISSLNKFLEIEKSLNILNAQVSDKPLVESGISLLMNDKED